MCGIAFLRNPDFSPSEGQKRISAALERMLHRGPDDGNVVLSGDALLGHRRLSIIDLSHSKQPMQDPSGRFCLTYNGEIYNYRDLRKSLDADWEFRTEGDTEVLLAGLLLKGEAFLEKLEGMWAFALWDSKQASLLLSRDRLGKKPLYYASDGAQFACASELPALLPMLARTPPEDLDSTADYFRYGCCLPGFTFYEGVREVLPGHTLRWSPSAPIIQTPYWSLPTERFGGSKEAARGELYRLFEKSVQKRLVADVEVGAFLSGGVDSSLITAFMARSSKRPVKTFSLGFPEESYDETKFARLVARENRTEHFEEKLPGWNEENLKNLLSAHLGQPFADASLLPTAMVAQLAHQHLKVVLSGDGGDELFSGYQRYQARSVLRWYSRLPRPLRSSAEQLVRLLPEPTSHHSRSLIKKAHLFVDASVRYGQPDAYVAPRLMSDAELTAVAPSLAVRGHQPLGIPHQTHVDDVQRMMLQDTLIYLPQDILVKVDRATMAHSLESRAPFLDHSLVELAFSLPREWHRNLLSGKQLLRSTFRGVIPASIWRRRKQGFGVPLGQWFRGELGSKLAHSLHGDTGALDSSTVSDWLQLHRSGKRDQSTQLWMIDVYLKWRAAAA